MIGFQLEEQGQSRISRRQQYTVEGLGAGTAASHHPSVILEYAKCFLLAVMPFSLNQHSQRQVQLSISLSTPAPIFHLKHYLSYHNNSYQQLCEIGIFITIL